MTTSIRGLTGPWWAVSLCCVRVHCYTVWLDASNREYGFSRSCCTKTACALRRPASAFQQIVRGQPTSARRSYRLCCFSVILSATSFILRQAKQGPCVSGLRSIQQHCQPPYWTSLVVVPTTMPSSLVFFPANSWWPEDVSLAVSPAMEVVPSLLSFQPR